MLTKVPMILTKVTFGTMGLCLLALFIIDNLK